jgi:RNA polymerase sigma factor (sigma-70 family)
VTHKGNLDALPDGALLELFAGHADGAAFEVLVVRHSAMVLSACRRVLGNDPAADDAAQATFIVLARKARRLEARESVAGWLYHVAVCTARNEWKAAQRRLIREQEGAAAMQMLRENQIGIEATPEALRTLTEELHSIPDKYREPVVLHHLEGLGYTEAADRMGLGEKAFSMRLVRGREMLRQRMKRRGIHMAMAGLLALLAVPANAVPHTTFAAATAKTALAAVSGGVAAAGIPPGIAAMVQGTMTSLSIAQARVCTLACATALGVSAVSGLTGYAIVRHVGPVSQPAQASTLARFRPISQDRLPTLEISFNSVPDDSMPPLVAMAAPGEGAGGGDPAGSPPSAANVPVPPPVPPPAAPPAGPAPDKAEQPPAAATAELMAWTVRRNQDLEQTFDSAKALLNDDRFEEAVPLIQKLIDSTGESVVRVDPSVFLSPRAAAETLLAKHSPAVLKAYRTLADASARSLLPQGRNSDEQALRAVATRFFYSSLGDDAAFGYATRAMAHGRSAVAREWLEKILDRHPDPDVPRWEILSRLFVAAAAAGDHEAAVRYGTACLASDVGLPDTVRQGIETEFSAIRTNIVARRLEQNPHTETVPTVPPGVAAAAQPPRTVWGRQWVSATDGPQGTPTNAPGNTVKTRRQRFGPAGFTAYANRYGVIGSRVLAAGSNVFVRAFGNLIAFEAQSGRELWRVQDPWPRVSAPSWMFEEPGEPMMIHFARTVDYTISAAGSRVYALERAAQAFADAAQGVVGTGKNAKVVPMTPGSSVVARDAASGALAWRVGLTEDLQNPFYGVRFLCAPVAAGGDRLFTVGLREATMELIELSPRDGSLVARTPFTAPSGAEQWSGTMPDRQAAICVDGARIVALAPNVGAISAIAADGGELLWSVRYRTRWDRLADRTSGESPRSKWAEGRLWAGGGIVLACPPDTSTLLAINPANGSIRYELDMGDPVSLIGVADGRAYVAKRSGVAAVDIASGTVRWTLPLPSTPARGVIADGRLYVPCVDRIVEVNLRTGSPARTLLVGEEQDPVFGNLAFAGGRIYSAAVLDVSAFEPLAVAPPPEPSRDDPAEWRAAVTALDAALARADLGDERRAQVRSMLFDTLCDAVASSVDDPSWQARIAQMTATPEEKARAAVSSMSRTARNAKAPDAVSRLVEESLEAGDAPITLENGQRRVQARRISNRLLCDALAGTGPDGLSAAEAVASKALDSLAARKVSPEAFRSLAEAAPGTATAIAAAARAARLHRENGEFAIGEAVLLDALDATTPGLIPRATAELSSHYAAAGWVEAASNAVAAGAELSAAARETPGASVPLLLALRRQRLAASYPVPDFRWREKGALIEGANTVLLDFENPWESPFFKTNALYLTERGSNLVCVSLDSMRPVWSVPAEAGPFYCARSGVRSRVFSEVAVPARGHIAILCEGANIVAVDLLRGRRIWTQVINKDDTQFTAGMAPSVWFACGNVIVRTDEYKDTALTALGAMDGTVRWARSCKRSLMVFVCGAGHELLWIRNGPPCRTRFVDAWNGASREGPVTGIEQVSLHDEQPFLTPDGIVLDYPVRTDSVNEQRIEFLPRDPAKAQGWTGVSGRAGTGNLFLPLNRDSLLIANPASVAARRLSDGKVLWEWTRPRQRIFKTVPADDSPQHMIVLAHASGSSLGSTDVMRLDTATGAAGAVAVVPAGDPRLWKVPMMVSTRHGFLLREENLPESNRQPQDAVWMIKGYSLTDGAALTNRITGANGATYSTLSIKGLPNLVVRGRHVLLVTSKGIRLFEAEDKDRR